MGLPEISIKFKTMSSTAVKRSARGIVALVLKDNTASFDTKEYTGIEEVDFKDYSAKNAEYIKMTFKGAPSKVIVERLSEDAADYNVALTRLKNKKWNYVSIPSMTNGSDLASYVKGLRATGSTKKAVVANVEADSEGVINFTTSGIKVEETTYNAAEYTCRVAGLLAGLPMTMSATYYKLPEIEAITESETPDADIDAGKLIIINDDGDFKFGRAVNSFVSATPEKGAEFSKIKVVESVDMIRDDITKTFKDGYVGKVANNYDNKVLFLSQITSYFKELEGAVLDRAYENKAEIDIAAHKAYLKGKGKEVDLMKEIEIKKANTGSTIFAKTNIKIVDSVEDLKFEISM